MDSVKRHRTRSVLCAAWIVAVLVPQTPGRAQSSLDGLTEVRLELLFPDARSFSAKSGELPHYEAVGRDAQGKPALLGYAFWTTEIEPLERGYDGPIPILVGLDLRARLTGVVATTMTDVDLLMMPTRHMTAPILGGYDSAVGPSLTRPFNLTGYPALSICNGFSNAGLPISLQIAGRPFQDHIVLQAGDAFEKATLYRTNRPTLTTSQAVAAN